MAAAVGVFDDWSLSSGQTGHTGQTAGTADWFDDDDDVAAAMLGLSTGLPPDHRPTPASASALASMVEPFADSDEDDFVDNEHAAQQQKAGVIFPADDPFADSSDGWSPPTTQPLRRPTTAPSQVLAPTATLRVAQCGLWKCLFAAGVTPALELENPPVISRTFDAGTVLEVLQIAPTVRLACVSGTSRHACTCHDAWGARLTHGVDICSA